MKENTIALALLSALLVAPAAAQNGDAKAELVRLKPNDFPTSPIEYTVVYPAGGGMDVTARLIAKYVEKWSDHRIIVNNRTGVLAWLATLISPPKPSLTDTRLASSPV
jgi:tripartite-type tricarboxylate transporter receptor subunit TctC